MGCLSIITNPMPTIRELRAQAKARKIKKYYSLNKAGLLSALGLKDDLKAHKLSKGKGDAITAQSQKLSKGNTTARAVIKGRLKRAIARDLRSAGGDLTQEMKREIAIEAIKREAKLIARGTKELRGGSRRKQQSKSLAKKTRAKKGMIDLPEKKTLKPAMSNPFAHDFTGSEAQVKFANDLMDKLKTQSDRWIEKRKAAIEKRSKTEKDKREGLTELWEEVRDLRIAMSIESAGVAIDYLKKMPLDHEIVERPSSGLKARMGYNKGIPPEFSKPGWTKNDKKFQKMVTHYGLSDYAPDYAK